MSSDIYLSIIIPTYNRSYRLMCLVDSLLNQMTEIQDYEIIIVDDESTDDTQNHFEKHPDSRVKYYRKNNGGASASRNFGAQQAKGEILLFVNDDCVVPNNWIKTYKKIFEDSSVDVAGGSVINQLDNLPDEVYDELLRTLFITQNKNGDIKFLAGCNVGCRKKVFETIEGFDGRFKYGFADRAFIERLRTKNYKIVFSHELYLDHYHAFTFPSFIRHEYKLGKGGYFFYNRLAEVKKTDSSDNNLRTKFGAYLNFGRNQKVLKHLQFKGYLLFSQCAYYLGYLIAFLQHSLKKRKS